MIDEEKKKEIRKNNNENIQLSESELNVEWQCYKDTGSC